MRDQTETDTPIFDAYLATFTDDLISGASSVETASQPGMEELEEVIRNLHTEIRLVHPDSDVRDRIHNNLIQQWNQSHSSRVADVDGMLQRWWRAITGGDSWRTQRQSQRLSAFALAGVVLVILIFFAISNVDTLQTLPASAVGDISSGALAISIGILVAAAALFFSRRKR